MMGQNALVADELDFTSAFKLAISQSASEVEVCELYIVIFLCTLAGMEAFAYAMHRWVMHGPGWFLHESHHRSRSGLLELNDLYALIFALPSVGLIYAGVQEGWGPAATSIGGGIAAYGFIYFTFHDVIVHKRIPNRYVPKLSYMKRIVQAHRLHHAVQSKRGAVSFGFMYAPPVAVLKKQLRANSEARVLAPERS